MNTKSSGLGCAPEQSDTKLHRDAAMEQNCSTKLGCAKRGKNTVHIKVYITEPGKQRTDHERPGRCAFNRLGVFHTFGRRVAQNVGNTRYTLQYTLPNVGNRQYTLKDGENYWSLFNFPGRLMYTVCFPRLVMYTVMYTVCFPRSGGLAPRNCGKRQANGMSQRS